MARPGRLPDDEATFTILPLHNRVEGCREIVCDLRSFLPALLAAAQGGALTDFGAWLEEIDGLRKEWPDTGELPDIDGINPNALMHDLSRASGAAGAYAVDVGQHQQWAAKSLELSGDQRFFTSGGMGAMGFGLPGALGATLALASPVLMIARDGSFQLNIQEQETVAQRGPPIKMVVLDNGRHGMVRQFQQSYFDERYQSTLWGYSAGLQACSRGLRHRGAADRHPGRYRRRPRRDVAGSRAAVSPPGRGRHHG